MSPTKFMQSLCALLCLAPPAAGAQNYVANGSFATDISGWQLSGPPLPTWATLDFQGDSHSGSALLVNDSAIANTHLYPLSQCITPPADTYLVSVRGFIPTGQTSGRLVLSYTAYDGPNCSGTLGDLGGQFLTQIGVWQSQALSFRIFNLPGASVRISLGIEKDAAGGVLQGNFDSIALVEYLFADGFDGH